MEVSDNPRMTVDPYTGTLYDANMWYRGVNGCWINKRDEERYRDALADLKEKRIEKRNANRVANGRRKRSVGSYARSARRYGEYLGADTEMTFREWLKAKEGERKILGRSY